MLFFQMALNGKQLRGDVHTQVVTDNGKRPFWGVGVLHQRVISVTKWHYRNNVAEILIKQVFQKETKKESTKKIEMNVDQRLKISCFRHF